MASLSCAVKSKIITLERMKKMKSNAIVGSIWRFDNEIGMDGLEGFLGKWTAARSSGPTSNQGHEHQWLFAHGHSDRCAYRDHRSAQCQSSLVLFQHLPHSGPCCSSHLEGRHLGGLCMKGETLPEYLGCTEQMMTVPDQDGCYQLVDDGGDATLLIHKGKEF